MKSLEDDPSFSFSLEADSYSFSSVASYSVPSEEEPLLVSRSVDPDPSVYPPELEADASLAFCNSSAAASASSLEIESIVIINA